MIASTSCAAAALSTVRPRSSKSPALSTRPHRRGQRSAAARLRRSAARRTQLEASAAQVAAEASGDGQGPPGGDLLPRDDGSLGGACGTIFNVDSRDSRVHGDDDVNVSVGSFSRVRFSAGPPKGDGHDDKVPSPVAAARQPRTTAATSSFELTFLHANIRSFGSKSKTKSAEIKRLIERSDFPTYVFFTETWRDKSSEELTLEGYVEVSRRDRQTSTHGGGIAAFAKAGFENTIVHIGDSKIAERSWHVIHSNRGPLLVGLWYRRPEQGEVLSIESLEPELAEFGDNVLGTIIIGDMNVHEQSWLSFSDGTTPEGRALRDLACSNGWEERVRKPTRGSYLLDLVLTDLGSDVKARPVPGVSDHSAVLGSLAAMVDEEAARTRTVFDFGKAPWRRISERLSEKDFWDHTFANLSVDDMALRFEEKVKEVLHELVPTKSITATPKEHPWLNDRCREAIDGKMAAVGTPREIEARDKCSQVLTEEHDKYVSRMRRKLSQLPRSDRGWWRLAKALAGKRSKSSGIQPLKKTTGEWVRSSEGKAELLAETFERKSRLPAEELNEYATIGEGDFADDTFLPVRCRDVKRVLNNLKLDSATGPDGLATRVLKNCADALSYPLARIIRAILSNGRWPQKWREHWVVPLYKRKSRADPSNYRGVHLTAQVSKAAERVLGRHFQKHLEQSGAYGDRQFAYTTGKSYGDALALSLLTWLLALERGQLVALYCSDVSGAFDRVCARRLGAKLATLKLHPRIYRVLVSWLEPRSSQVVVEGAFSSATPLCDSVFQGTVWGAPLWNCYYADASEAVAKQGFTDIVFADDLNCTKVMDPQKTNGEVLEEARQCQEEVHAWGRGNRVIFDAGKESFHILHRGRGQGENFVILGTEFDVALDMHSAAHTVSTEAGWRLKTLLRTRRFHSIREMMNIYKAQVLSYIESRTVGMHHAAPTTLLCVDRVQRKFLREMAVSEREALADWNLAPLPCRRAIAMLGLLYRIAMRQAPEPLCQLFRRDYSTRSGHTATRGFGRRHSLQLCEATTMGGHTEVFRRSLFGLVTVWNMVPEAVVRSGSVHSFQRGLQEALRRRALETPEFSRFFTDAMRMTVQTFQAFFAG